MQYMRYKEVLIGGMTFTSDKIDIEFTVPFDDDPEPNESEIRIFNLSDRTIHQIQQEMTLTLNAGYLGDIGEVLTGRIAYVNTEKQGPDKITRLFVVDGPDLSNVTTERRAYADYTKGSTILQDLVPMLKLPIAAFRLPSDKTYTEGYSVTGKILDNIREVAKDCGASFYVSKGKIYIRALNDGDDTRFTLSTDTGLIGSPEAFRDGEKFGYRVRCLMQYRITTASIIGLSSKYVNGQYRARKGKHIAQGTEFITECEVV